MKEETCYVVVDKDVTEKISNSLPIRRKGIRSVWWGLTQVFYSKNNSNKWSDGFSNDEKDALPFMGVILPKGTIEKIIGRKMTWDDEPIKILSK